MNRIRHWPLRRDERSGVLIGAGGRRWRSREKRSIARVQGQFALSPPSPQSLTPALLLQPTDGVLSSYLSRNVKKILLATKPAPVLRSSFAGKLKPFNDAYVRVG